MVLFASAAMLMALSTPAALPQVPPQRLPRQRTVTTAALQGVVQDEAGRGLSGAEVKLTDARGFVTTKVTTGDGVFLIGELAPSVYTARAELAGYEATEQSGIALQAGQVQALVLTLKASPAPDTKERALPTPGIEPAAPGEVTSEPADKRNVVRSSSGSTIIAVPVEPLPGDERVFFPMPDRWRYRFPERAGSTKGHFYDPFHRNRLKGDYPIIGNRTFLNFNLVSTTFLDGRKLPTPSNVPSERPDSYDFFGRPGQFFLSQNLAFSVSLFRGDTAFRPIDWQIRFTPEINVNYFAAQELGIVNADPAFGTGRLDSHVGLQEGFAEVKLKDFGHAFDFVSARAGIQSFSSDFRGFIFNDQEPGLRVFGNLKSNRYQYNVAAFAMLEKDSNSGLNTFEYRHQQVYIANLYRQDFLAHGYTIQVSFHYDKDDATVQYDTNNFLVRPAPLGSVRPHSIRAYYYGLTGDGHIGKLNLTHAFYQVLGHDKLNGVADRPVDINAQMAAAELSLDRDWLRYRVSFYYASGDSKPDDGTARGFDAIFDTPNFAGGIFSFWNREGIRLTGSGVALVSNDSLNPSLRASKTQGQANFVNPGLYLYNAGVDADVTPKLRAFVNLNLVKFAHTEPLEFVLFQRPIHHGVGADSGIGITYRPPLSENISITAGFNAFFPFRGFRDIYTGQTLLSLFTSVRFRF